MTIESELDKRKVFLNGSTVTESDVNKLIKSLPSELLPSWFIAILQKYPLIGICFSLDEIDDESEIGVDFKWLSPDQMIEEALLLYPGKVVLELGYIPVASCLVGSGDPYFLKIKGSNREDPPLVRIPHEFALNDEGYPEDEIEVVCGSLSEFFNKSDID